MITYHFIILVKNICVNIHMLQIDHIYRFFNQLIFNKDFFVYHLPDGVVDPSRRYMYNDLKNLFNYTKENQWKNLHKILFYDQEPLLNGVSDRFMELFYFPGQYTLEYQHANEGKYEEEIGYTWMKLPDQIKQNNLKNPKDAYGQSHTLVTSEHSMLFDQYCKKYNFNKLYYFFHGFASLDWFRGFQTLNFKKSVIKNYKYDYQSFNRIVTGDRAYRKTFVDQLRANDLLKYGAVSYGVTDDPVTGERLVIDHEQLPGSASADIPDVDAFWHIVTETVFYYDKLHLTEKIFKPIVSKQPFMLLAAPGNLEYLRSYGFKTFGSWIDESYDNIKDHDQRIQAVVEQIKWWANLSDSEKYSKMCVMESVIEHNFHHFYGKFREIITDELLDNTKKLFEDIGYNDTNVDYATVRKLLTS